MFFEFPVSSDQYWQTWNKEMTMSNVTYGEQKQILVSVRLDSDYKCMRKPEYPKMSARFWAEGERKEKAPQGFNDSPRPAHIWSEECSVWDTRKEETLPEQIFVLVQASQTYDGQFAPTSWFATEAYAKRENAEERAKRETANTWYWVLPVNRFASPV